MSVFSPLTQQLIDALRCLPSIGTKSAQRMAFHLLGPQQRAQGQQLAQTIALALERIQRCPRCQNYTEEALCSICQNPKRDDGLLCIVETPADIIALEQTHCFQGRYYVLHGHLSPLDGIGPEELHIPSLLNFISQQPIKELIIATNPTMEGKATAHYIATHLANTNITISRIAYGVPLGGEIEYLDGHTLAHAINTRLPFVDQS